MATLKNITVSRFHNLSDEALADAIGRADAIVKGAEAELTAAQGRIQGARPFGSRRRRFHGDGVRTDFGPDRCQGREGTARRALQRLREGHHLDRHSHQGGQPARARGLSRDGGGAMILPP